MIWIYSWIQLCNISASSIRTLNYTGIFLILIPISWRIGSNIHSIFEIIRSPHRLLNSVIHCLWISFFFIVILILIESKTLELRSDSFSVVYIVRLFIETDISVYIFFLDVRWGIILTNIGRWVFNVRGRMRSLSGYKSLMQQSLVVG